MGSDDFIDLDATSDSNNQEENSDHHKLNCEPIETDDRTTSSHLNEDISNGNDFKTYEKNGGREEVQHIETTALEVDSVQKQPILEESVQLFESVVTVENLDEIQPEQATDNADNGCADNLSNTAAKIFLTDESPIAGVKRARMTYVDQQPSVRVVYNSLTRESKKKLMELMQQWSEWHAQCNYSSNASSKESLEYGEEIYFPALHVGSEKTSTVSFWVDNQIRKEGIKDIQMDDDLVPLYDRGYTLGSTSLHSSSEPERTLEASRCFNCGSYNHSLKECPKPRDNVAINNARKQHNSKRNPTPGSRGQARYYQKSSGKFDDLKAGVLGPETRESLGIGEFDPPPWLHRMRELGYPPGYLDVVEDGDQPSGITIFADGEEMTKVEYEEGEIPEKGEPVAPSPLEKQKTVEFPGINAPIPENADHRLWAPPAAISSGFRNRSHHRLNSSSDSLHGHYPDHQRTDSPPGVDYGPSSASAVRYSPRYSPYDHNYPPMYPRSPNLGRSLSDRALGSPTAPYESSPAHSPHSPYPYSSSIARQSPAHHYHNPSASLEHWAHEAPYGASPDMSSQQGGRDRHDHHRHHHHHDRRHDHRK